MITGSLAIAECSENMGSATNESMHIAQTNQNSQSLLCNMTTESLWNENSYLDEQLMATSMHVAEPYGSTSTTQVEQVDSNIQMEAVTDQNSNTEFFFLAQLMTVIYWQQLILYQLCNHLRTAGEESEQETSLTGNVALQSDFEILGMNIILNVES